ncbi:MAG: hypothetical protein HYY20_13555 [Candidatus Tectomicrobia bacterium]|uniref:Uncharacterized protein n=1 Tax=Tectimicrobiota bacterium TaxID=2528274 RepID=A0A932CRN7_UNCTE|nr:hypothetical protein [Candidatus Tectomicrobia bacterium]
MSQQVGARRRAAQLLEEKGISHYLIAVLTERGTRWQSKGDSVWLNGVAVILNRFLNSTLQPAPAKGEGTRGSQPEPAFDSDKVREQAVKLLDESGITNYLIAHFSEAEGTRWSLKGDRAWLFGMSRMLGLFLERGLRPSSEKEDLQDEQAEARAEPKGPKGLEDTDWKIPDYLPKDW